MEGEIKQDTACFSTRQWYIEGRQPGPMFTTEKDAQEAQRLGYKMAQEAVEEVGRQLQYAVDKIRWP